MTALLGVICVIFALVTEFALRDFLIKQLDQRVSGAADRRPNGQITEVRYFPAEALPEMGPRTRARVRDAFQSMRGIVRIFEVEDG